MKQVCAAMMIVLLLCGCAAVPQAKTEERPLSYQPPDAEAEVLSLPVIGVSAPSPGAIEIYPLYLPDSYGLYPMGTDLLVISCADNQSLLTKISGLTMKPVAAQAYSLDFTGALPGLQVSRDQISFYDPQASQTVVLDPNLRETARIAAPEDLIGTPLLSQDGSTLFYCAQDALRSLDLSSGISKVLKEFPCSEKNLCALLLGDTVLQCRYLDEGLGERFLFLSTATGRTLYDSDCTLELQSSPWRYYASFPSGAAQALVFGTPEEAPLALLPEELSASCTFLPESNGAVTCFWSEDYSRITMRHYDLSSGLLTGQTTMATSFSPWYLCSAADGTVYFMLYSDQYGCDCLCRWKPDPSAPLNGVDHTGPYYSAEYPDLEGLLRCEKQAQSIGEQFGIRILTWTDAALVQPGDYDLTPEYRTELIEEALTQLQSQLRSYPEGFFQTLGSCADSITICLVRSLTPTPGSQGRSMTGGLQFWDGRDAYIILTIGPGSEMALYHELCHLIDTRVFSESNAYDDWDSLNPGEFAYDYDYIANRSRSDYQFLQETSRSFIDIYSMSYPKEDRARIMEYAMTEGHKYLFDAPMLQQKLVTLCTGIREAFQLTEYPDPLPWEQYLWRPMAPQFQD